jgi:anthranilate synthase component 1
MTTPTFSEFKRLAKRYNLIPLSRETVADRVTPVSVYDRLRFREPYSFLLESVEGGERFGRYSFVGRNPRGLFICKGRQVTYREGKKERTWTTQNPLQDLKALFKEIRTPVMPGLQRFWGGAVGYWDYDTVRFFEKIPDRKPDLLGFPTGAFQLSGDMVVFDRLSQSARVISNVYIPPGKKSHAALASLYRQGQRAIEEQIRRMNDHQAFPREPKAQGIVNPKASFKKSDYMKAVRKAKEHIRAGDIIQVVLSQRWMLQPKATPFQVYRALRMVNPSPYMYMLHFKDMDIVGSSPELLVRKEGDVAETRPIAGTRRRGFDAAEDQVLAQQLLRDPKERAEHLMLVDLGRNDLGRVCRPGSVQVPELMTVENYSHVMHLVSAVTGKLDAKANAFDLFQACFPAGTVAGAPKIRAMQIIDELEPSKRGPYAGAVGYFSYNGNMDMAITIRTMVFHKDKAYMQAGAGIVADSDPAKEYRECEQKAAALFAAVRKTGDLS